MESRQGASRSRPQFPAIILGRVECLERKTASLCEQQRFGEAATEAIRGYGPEVLGYLFAATGTAHEASDLFAVTTEELWRSLPIFRWRCSLRTWFYRLARHALHRFRKQQRNYRLRHMRLSAPEVAQIADRVRATTLPHLRTTVKDRVFDLRRQLDPDDLTILVLRVDRNMSWRSIVMVLGPGDIPPDQIVRRSAALRKRFERIKTRLRLLLESDGVKTSSADPELRPAQPR